MPQILFTHKNIARTLKVETGANQITWGYGLNAQSFPTYGGEVVQILSAYIDDLIIQGEVGSYKEMEDIYSWFLEYMQLATQPADGQKGYHENPCKMSYPEREWAFLIQVKSLPGFHLGTEVVAPTWQIQAQVVEEDPAMAELTLTYATENGFTFERLNAGIGYDEDNPFTNAFASDEYDPQEASDNLADFYSNLVKSYHEGDFDALYQGFYGSQPPTPSGSSSQASNTGGGKGGPKGMHTTEPSQTGEFQTQLGKIF